MTKLGQEPRFYIFQVQQPFRLKNQKETIKYKDLEQTFAHLGYNWLIPETICAKPLNDMHPENFQHSAGKCHSDLVCLGCSTGAVEVNLFLSFTGLCRALCSILCGIQRSTYYRFCPSSFYCLIRVREG